jgi:thioredoxin-like negative regulator of GroEL
MAKALEFTTESWDKEVVHSDQPVLVDFWGPG